jgi:hypothetical protein
MLYCFYGLILRREHILSLRSLGKFWLIVSRFYTLSNCYIMSIVISWLYRTCWNNLATSLIISTRLLQVVNSLFQTCWQLGTSSAKTTCCQLVGRLATRCEIFACVENEQQRSKYRSLWNTRYYVGFWRNVIAHRYLKLPLTFGPLIVPVTGKCLL